MLKRGLLVVWLIVVVFLSATLPDRLFSPVRSYVFWTWDLA